MTPCENCNRELVEVDFNKHRVSLCDNWRCRLYRQPQGTRVKGADPVPSQPARRRCEMPGYQAYLRRKREGYRYARSLGFTGREAAVMAGCSEGTIRQRAEERSAVSHSVRGVK